MSTYKLKTGDVHPYKSFMSLPKLSDGYVWQDFAPLGSDHHDWLETPSTEKAAKHDEIFGYSMSDLLAKQYR